MEAISYTFLADYIAEHSGRHNTTQTQRTMEPTIDTLYIDSNDDPESVQSNAAIDSVATTVSQELSGGSSEFDEVKKLWTVLLGISTVAESRSIAALMNDLKVSGAVNEDRLRNSVPVTRRPDYNGFVVDTHIRGTMKGIIDYREQQAQVAQAAKEAAEAKQRAKKARKAAKKTRKEANTGNQAVVEE